MISVLLTILKIIGIVLLCLLGFLLLALLSILLVPLRYQAEADCQEKKFSGNVSLTWLLHALSVRAGYGPEEGMFFRVRVLGFSLLDSRKKKKPESKETGNASETEVTVPDISKEILESLPPEGEAATGTEAKMTTRSDASETEEKKEKTFSEKTETQVRKEKNNRKKKETKEEKRARKEKEKVRREEEKARKKAEKEQKKAEKAIRKEETKKKREALKERAEDFLDMIQDKENQKSLQMVKGQVGKLLCHVLPQKFQLSGRIGLSDPAATAQLIGVIYAFYPLYGEHIRVEAEFEEEVLEGHVFLKGRIRIGTLIIRAARVVLDKNVRRMMKAIGGKKHVRE